jgi:phage terminase large subunit GpA-like protein
MAADMPGLELDQWRQAVRAPEQITPSEWAEKYRVLERGQTPRPGPWRNDAAPYLRMIMDFCCRPGIIELDVVKAAQIGVSEACRNVIGWFAYSEAEPCGLALPSYDKGHKIMANRITPMFRRTAVLRDLFSGVSADLQGGQIKLLNGFLLHLMWAGSATSMSAEPIRLGICDEVDKFAPWVGREADAVSLMAKRLRAYGHRGVQVNISTPTTRLGRIWNLFEGADVRLYFYVPCPHCGAWQRLVMENLKWENPPEIESKTELAAYVMQQDACWYECAECKGRIVEAQRPEMIRAGRYQSPTGSITDAYGEAHESAETIAVWPTGTHLGIQLPAFYCLWAPWAAIAAEFIRAKGNLTAQYDFRTQTLAEPFEQQIVKISTSVFSVKSQSAELEEGVAPEWAVKLLATIDTQHDHFWLVIRAWGAGMRSVRIWHGRVENFDALDDLLFRKLWPTQRPDFPAMQPELVLIDSGGTRMEGDPASRTMQVYRWSLARRSRVRPIKGASQPKRGLFIWPGRGWVEGGRRNAEGKPIKDELRIWYLDTHHFGDELADLIGRGIGKPDEEIWHLNSRDDEEYNRHLSNAVKVLVRRGSTMAEEWLPIAAGAHVDLYDCEVYQLAAAYMANIHVLPTQQEIDRYRQTLAEAQATAPAPELPVQGPPAKMRDDPWKPTRLKI